MIPNNRWGGGVSASGTVVHPGVVEFDDLEPLDAEGTGKNSEHAQVGFDEVHRCDRVSTCHEEHRMRG